jgi:hypothetical protein
MYRMFLAAATTVAVWTTGASAAFIVNVVPSVGPDRAFSPDFAQYAQNAAYGLYNNGSGTPSTNGVPVFSASYYQPLQNGTQTGGGSINALGQPLTDVNVIAAGVTNLWQGVVNNTDPAAVNQTGNWVYFGLTITTTAGETFMGSDVNFDGVNYPAFGVSNFGAQSLAGANNLYSEIGGVLQPVTDSTVVDNLYYVGLGYTIQNFAPGDYSTPGQLQAYMFDPLTPSGNLSGGYTIAGTSATGSVDINGVPAPATIGLMGLGLAALVSRVRRRMA